MRAVVRMEHHLQTKQQKSLKSIFYGLVSSKYLILTAPTFEKTSLKATEEVVKFSNIVEPIADDTFQKLYDAGS